MSDQSKSPVDENPNLSQQSESSADLEPNLSTARQIADRPHWITIALGLVSPTVGIVALVISGKSLDIAQRVATVGSQAAQTSERALKTAQRAYLYLREQQVDTTVLGAKEQFSQLDIKTSFQIYNAGNTPADVSSTSSLKHPLTGTTASMIEQAR